MAAELSAVGATSGQFELFDGSLSRISYCIPAECTDGSTAVTFSSTREAETPARFVAGSATVGFRDGRRLAHCHAAWFDARGELRGGHVWPETEIGSGPVHAVMHAFDDIDMISGTDAESHLPVFTPHRRPAGIYGGEDASRAVMTRLAPGVNVEAAVFEIMREHEIARASISGSVGSLVGAVLDREVGILLVDGPATEVSLIGEFDLKTPDRPVSSLSGIAVDRFGGVHVGDFVKEQTIVGVTMELLVEEKKP